MNVSVSACSLLSLCAMLPVMASEPADRTGAFCQSDTISIAYADAFDLADWSETCLAAGDPSTAAALFLLAALRRNTDLQFMDQDLGNSEPADFVELELKLEVLGPRLYLLMADQPESIPLALDQAIAYGPAMPPFYSPRIPLQDDAADYSNEFYFQFAALNVIGQLQSALAHAPGWRDLVVEMNFIGSHEYELSSSQEARLAALLREQDRIFSSAARTVAERITAREIRAIIRSYGIYRSVGSPSVSLAENTPSGLFLDFDAYIHVETTEQIPVRWGESFGLKADLAGVPIGVPVQLEWSLAHGPLPSDDGQPSTSSRDRFSRSSMDGTLTLQKFLTFVENFPVACGPWRVELKYQSETLVAQDFFVYGCN